MKHFLHLYTRKCKLKVLTPCSNIPVMMDSSITEFLSISDTKGCIFSIANLATKRIKTQIITVSGASFNMNTDGTWLSAPIVEVE